MGGGGGGGGGVLTEDNSKNFSCFSMKIFIAPLIRTN